MIDMLGTFIARFTKARAANIDNLDLALASILSTGINSIQQGTVTLGANIGAATATITSVTTSKSVVFFAGEESSEAVALPSFYWSMVDPQPTSATTVAARRMGSGIPNSVTIVGFTVVEFK